MPRAWLNGILLVAFAASLAAIWGLQPDPARPNLEFIPEMARTARFNAFAANPNFTDGKTLREPVRGTIPRGMLPLHYDASAESARRAGEELRAPRNTQDSAAVERGERVFLNFCLPCHGATAAGDGPVIARGYPAPPSLLAPNALAMKDGQMFHLLTFSQKNMPGYARQISREDRWKVIAYVRSVQKKKTPTASESRP